IPVPVPVLRLPRGAAGPSRLPGALPPQPVGRPVRFTLGEGVHVTAHFGATDLGVANFYVSQLQTPIGVQAEALLRCSDIISSTFKL
uniref:Gem nuclear organelle associated protein 7 n=1 Tax=Jaculus jaculus TaxID=51337 RepID=A0A8C5JYI4_JACJA